APARGDACDAAWPLASPGGSTLAASVILGNGYGTARCPCITLFQMLFYEPLFATFFLVFFALYLLATGASAKKWTLLIASLLFYVWGEPVFVLVLLASAVIDYALSLHLGEPTPPHARRLALTAGIACNLGVLAGYKYADFAIENLDRLMSPFGAHPFPLLHLALPIG